MDLIHNTSVAAPFLRTTIATFMAVVGGGLGAVLTRGAERRLNVLVYTAMGILLLVTVGDILPDAKADLTWPEFLLGALSGMALFWAVSKYIYHICPACAIHTFDNAALARLGQTAVLFMVALGIHATMDGLAVVIGDEIAGRANLGVLFAVSIHKLPEGMALALLLIGAGYSRSRAFWLTVGIEMMTEFGALGGVLFLRGLPPVWLGIIFAHVGGGFLYLVGTTLNSFRLLAPHAHKSGQEHVG
jgi:zinc transporter, ZIP family